MRWPLRAGARAGGAEEVAPASSPRPGSSPRARCSRCACRRRRCTGCPRRRRAGRAPCAARRRSWSAASAVAIFAQRPAEVALVVGVVACAGRTAAAASSSSAQHRLVLVERVVGRADHDRRERDREAAERPAAVHRVAVQAQAGRAVADVDVDHQRVLERPVRGDARRLEADALRAASPSGPSRSPQSSSIVHSLLRRDEEQHPLGVPCSFSPGSQRLAHVVRRVRDAGAVGDLAVELASRRRPAWRARSAPPPTRARKSPSPKISACACSSHQEPIWSAWLAASPRHHAVVGAAAGDLDEQPHVGRHVELVAAVAPRHVEPVEARLQELLVELLASSTCAPRVSAWCSISRGRSATARSIISCGVGTASVMVVISPPYRRTDDIRKARTQRDPARCLEREHRRLEAAHVALVEAEFRARGNWCDVVDAHRVLASAALVAKLGLERPGGRLDAHAAENTSGAGAYSFTSYTTREAAARTSASLIASGVNEVMSSFGRGRAGRRGGTGSDWRRTRSGGGACPRAG